MSDAGREREVALNIWLLATQKQILTVLRLKNDLQPIC